MGAELRLPDMPLLPSVMPPRLPAQAMDSDFAGAMELLLNARQAPVTAALPVQPNAGSATVAKTLLQPQHQLQPQLQLQSPPEPLSVTTGSMAAAVASPGPPCVAPKVPEVPTPPPASWPPVSATLTVAGRSEMALNPEPSAATDIEMQDGAPVGAAVPPAFPVDPGKANASAHKVRPVHVSGGADPTPKPIAEPGLAETLHPESLNHSEPAADRILTDIAALAVPENRTAEYLAASLPITSPAEAEPIAASDATSRPLPGVGFAEPPPQMLTPAARALPAPPSGKSGSKSAPATVEAGVGGPDPQLRLPLSSNGGGSGMTVAFAVTVPSAEPSPTITQATVITPERQIDLTADDQWLSQIARDIAAVQQPEGAIQFRLLPRQLGQIDVAIRSFDGGIAIQIVTETDAARTILAGAQPRLAEELRGQGVRVDSTEFLQSAPSGGQNSPPGHGDAQRSPNSARLLHSPFVETGSKLPDRTMSNQRGRHGRYA